MTGQALTLRLTSDPQNLCAVRGLVRAYVAALGFDSDRTEEVVHAVDEACANSIRHSYQGEGGRTIQLGFRHTPRWFVVELQDGGKPAPMGLRRSRSHAANPNEIRPGGLGLRLLYDVFDSVEYRPGKTRGNRVTMKLRRPGRSGKTDTP